MRPTLLIADDYRLYADALRSMLSSEFEVLGIAANGRELVELAVQVEPVLIITDHTMPLLTGIEAIRTLVSMKSNARFVVLSMHKDVSLVVEAFRAGASAYVLKTASRGEFADALTTVQDGRCYISAQIHCDMGTILAEAAKP